MAQTRKRITHRKSSPNAGATPRRQRGSTTPPPPETPRQRFDRLADRWEAATRNMSSVQGQIGHDDYIRIVAMGPSVVPFILERMRSRPGYWFAALRALTESDPVLESHRGDIHAMTDDWLQWGRKHGHLR